MRTITIPREAIVGEEHALAHDLPIEKDLTWTISGNVYTIQNVPTYEMNAEEQDYHDLDVVDLLTMVRNLMYADEIPHVVDFNDIADLV